MKCLIPGTKDTDSDLIFGLEQPYGYTKANCALVVKRELLARQLLDCSFGSVNRCGPLQSATYYRSFIDANNTNLNGIQTVGISANIQAQIDKECIQDCVQDRYGVTSSYADLSDNLKADLQSKMVQAGATGPTNVVVLKFFLNSMEYNKIHNFPQHGLQFLAEVKKKKNIPNSLTTFESFLAFEGWWINGLFPRYQRSIGLRMSLLLLRMH